MYRKAVELAEKQRLVPRHQFETAANADIHEHTTAREILADFDGERLDYFVTGYGTGGTVTGVGRVLRKERPETKIILSEPANAQLVGSGMAQERGADGRRPPATRPSSRTRSRAGRRISSRWCCRKPSTSGYYDELIPVAGPTASPGRRSWRRRKASSPAFPAARPSPSP
jgi:cysteine synthase A